LLCQSEGVGGILNTMEAILFAAFFVFGLIIGSFMNMALTRYNTGLHFNKRSFCFSCGHTLSWYDLIPLVSFIIQKRRCRYCGVRISLRYPVIEFIAGVLFVFLLLKLTPPFSTYQFLLIAYYLLTFGILLAIAAYDMRHKIIPDILVYSFIALSLASVFLISANVGPTSGPHSSLLTISNLFAGPLLALPFAALWFFSKGKLIGLGDAKLALGIGWG